MLNWKNVQYANGAGLVNAIRGNNAQMNEANQQMVDSISQFGDDYSKTQTDAALAELAGSTDSQQAQDILRGYAQGGNGFVDQGLLAQGFQDQTKEFRAAEAHSDSLLTNKAARAENEYKTSDEYRQYQRDMLNLKIDQLGNEVDLTKIKKGEAVIRQNLMKGFFPQHFTDQTNTGAPANGSQATGDLTSNSNASTNVAPGITNYGSLSILPTDLQGPAKKQFDASNLKALKEQFPALEPGSTNAEWFAHRAKINEALLRGGVSADNADRLQTNLFGQYGRQLDTKDTITTAVTRDQKQYLSNVNSTITTAGTAPKNIEGWRDTFTGMTLHGGVSKVEAVKQYLPQLTKFMREDLKKTWMDEEYTDTSGRTIENSGRQGLSDGNFALELIQNDGIRDGMMQRVQSLGLGEAANKIILDSLNKNLGVTTLQKSRNASLEASLKDSVAYYKQKDKRIADRDNPVSWNKMLGPPEKYQGAHEDVGEAYNILQQDSDLYEAGFLHNTDIFYKGMRRFNPGADNDSAGLDTGSSLTGDFEIGTMAKQSGDYRDYSLARTNPDLLERLENHNPDEKSPDHVTLDEIEVAQWRTDEPSDVALVMKIVILADLKEALGKESLLENRIKNFR